MEHSLYDALLAYIEQRKQAKLEPLQKARDKALKPPPAKSKRRSSMPITQRKLLRSKRNLSQFTGSQTLRREPSKSV